MLYFCGRKRSISALRSSLRIESNLFENVSSSIEALGSGYPEIALGGNVINNSIGYGLFQDQIRSTLKCNYFNDAAEGVYVRGSGSINMSPAPVALDITLAPARAMYSCMLPLISRFLPLA